MFCNMYVANNSSILQYCHGMSIEGVLVFYRTIEYTRIRGKGGGGGLNCEAKAQVLVVTPPPLFFLEVGRKRGGRNSGAVQYLPKIVLGQSFAAKRCPRTKICSQNLS